MTDEEKVTNGRNSRGSHQLRNTDLTAAGHVNLAEITESVIKTAEERLQDVSGNLIPSPAIDPSIYQTDVVTADQTTSTTVAPTPAAEPAAEVPIEGAATESALSAESEQPLPPEDAPPDQPAAAAAAEVEPQEPTPAPEMAEKLEPAEASAEPEAKAEMAEAQELEKPAEESATPTSDTDEKKTDEKSERGAKATSVDGITRRTTTTEVTTTETPSKDPYQIDIPIDRKINKRTQRKLWEEIEKRKPLIPKYVERHIQKYAKPPFELWGCKFRGKGSCYGCGG